MGRRSRSRGRGQKRNKQDAVGELTTLIQSLRSLEVGGGRRRGRRSRRASRANSRASSPVAGSSRGAAAIQRANKALSLVPVAKLSGVAGVSSGARRKDRVVAVNHDFTATTSFAKLAPTGVAGKDGVDLDSVVLKFFYDSTREMTGRLRFLMSTYKLVNPLQTAAAAAQLIKDDPDHVWFEFGKIPSCFAIAPSPDQIPPIWKDFNWSKTDAPMMVVEFEVLRKGKNLESSDLALRLESDWVFTEL